MEGNDLLLVQDDPLTATKCSGIECPDMIKEDTLVGEQDNNQQSDGKELKEFEFSEKATNAEEKKDEAKKADQVEARVALESDEGYTALTEHLRSANENEPSQNEGEEISFDDGNNNCKGEESTGKKEGIRKTRFSSEVTIEPKAYFQAGTDAIVTMPPSSDDDVFQEKNNQTSSSLVILNAKPADQSRGVHPDTFYPLTIFTCMFCCPMIGLFAIYKSYSVKKLNSKGEFFEAREASEHARQLGILTLIVGFFFVIAIITIAVLVATLA